MHCLRVNVLLVLCVMTPLTNIINCGFYTLIFAVLLATYAQWLI